MSSPQTIETDQPESARASEPRTRRTRGYLNPLVLGVLLLAIAISGPGNLMSVATTALIFGIAGIGLTVLAGPTKVVNLGGAAFVGVGAFTAAYLNNVVQVDFTISAAVAVLAAIALGWVVAPIASRLTGIYIAVITVGLAFLAQHVFRVADPWTGGTEGIQLTSIPFLGTDLAGPVRIGSYSIDPELVFFVLCSVVVMIVAILASNLLNSRSGRALHVIGTSSLTSRSFGINPSRHRGKVFVFAAALCGLAGALLAGRQGFVAWEQFDLLMCIDLIALVVLGGLGSVYGALAGAAILYTLPALVNRFEGVLPFLSSESSGVGLSPEQFTSVLFGISLILVMILEPGGLAALVNRGRTRITRLTASTRKETTS